MNSQPPKRKRNAELTRRAILDSALLEFSELGYGDARVDSIAARSNTSKPMIYSYFGDKEGLYAAALREAYVQIRSGESELELESFSPVDAIRRLVHFTLEHFWAKPWFISMLNTENLRKGTTIANISDLDEIQSPTLGSLEKVLKEGVEQGVFREDVNTIEFYITIASLCYFPISNAYTLSTVFNIDINDEWIKRRGDLIEEAVLGYLLRKN
ncbi:TetR family transcriptional regulator [Parasalinivibrio latis]|uniref:TetR family transcriptional regulator n=1 Tax=Parasalinivibrio latis TaxID=2952610 RepID=UPI0030E3B4BF